MPPRLAFNTTRDLFGLGRAHRRGRGALAFGSAAVLSMTALTAVEFANGESAWGALDLRDEQSDAIALEA